VAVCCLAELVLHTSAGLEWGTRYALLLFPLAAAVLASAKLPAAKCEVAAAIALLVTLSVATQVRGLRQLRSDQAWLSDWTKALLAASPATAMTDVWWVGLATTPAYYHHEYVYVSTPERVQYVYTHRQQASSPLAYVGFAGQLPPAILRYFEPISTQTIAPRDGPPLWIVALAPRTTPTA
jgi:hypothetical protein